MLQNNPLTAQVNKAKRITEVVTVLVRHGFAHFVERSGLAGLVEGGLEMLGHAPFEPAETHSTAVRLRRVLEDLGTTYIKLGQILSTRPDVLTPDIIDEFRKLQSDAPKVDFDAIKERMESSLHARIDEIFASIDEEPLAAASIAQVHRAVLLDGTHVVVKVMRPGVEAIVRNDLAVLRDIAKFADGHLHDLGFSPTRVADEFTRQLEKELNMMHEGRATERLAEYFEDDDGVRFPTVYWAATSDKVLALEEIRGAQLSKPEAEQLTPQQRRAASENGTMAVFRMCLEHGFFHADPHPGNIFVLSDGTVCFIDCGMTGHIDTRTRLQLGQLVRGVLEADLERTVRVAIEIGQADPGLESDHRFRADAWDMIARFESRTLQGIDMTALLDQFFELLRKHRVQCPADLVYLIKALTTIEGVAQHLDPNFNVVSHVKTMLTRLYAQQFGYAALRSRLTRSIAGYVELLEDLPVEVRKVWTQFQRRDFSVRLEHQGLDDLRDAILRTGRFLSISLVLSAVLVGSAILIHTDNGTDAPTAFTIVGRVTFVIALGFLVIMVLGNLRRK